MNSEDWAGNLAGEKLAVEFPRRWNHVRAAAAKAESLRPVLGDSADMVISAVWLHDIGYASELAETGFHPLDGARYLMSLGIDSQICGLVAYHSGAGYEAKLRGLNDLLDEFIDEPSLARDAVWFCDMTTGPTGVTVSFDQRLAEIVTRYGSAHTVPRGIQAARSEIREAIDRVTRLVEESSTEAR